MKKINSPNSTFKNMNDSDSEDLLMICAYTYGNSGYWPDLKDDCNVLNV